MNVSFIISKSFGKTAQSVASALVFSPISEQIEMVALLDPAGLGKPTFLNVRINGAWATGASIRNFNYIV